MGFKEIPEPVNGTLTYYADTGLVSIIEDSKKANREVIVLKTGVRVEGSIIAEQDKIVLVKHNKGLMTIKRNEIDYIYSNALNTIDKQLLVTLKDYIDIFQKKNSRYPADLAELLVFLKSYSIERIPEPSKGKLRYDSKDGSLRIVKSYSALSNEKTGFTNENPTEKEKDPKEKNVFEFEGGE